MKSHDNTRHRDLCNIGAKWLKKHDQNILVPNCAIIAIDLVTIEGEKPDIIGWCSWCSVMIEVKVGRGYFIKDDKKIFRQISEKGVGQIRYYLCPTGLIKDFEIPKYWGLLYINDEKNIDIIRAASVQKSNLNAERNMLVSLVKKK